MREKKRTIMLGFHSPVDAKLMREWLRGLGYEVVESLEDTYDMDLVLMDSVTALGLMDKVLRLKKEAKYFLPCLVCIGPVDDVARWLNAGFDDVLRLPATKAEWDARIKIMLRLRRQSEELGQKSEAILLHTLENMSDGFVALDEHWHYTYVNKKAGELLGRRPEDLIGKHIWTEFPEGIGQPFYKRYYKAVETQKPIFFEDYYPPWDRWFENRVFPSKKGLVIFFQDITERKKAEEELRQSRERLNHLFTVNPAIVYALDPETFSPTWVSPNVTEITGYTPEEALQPRWWEEHVHPEDREETNKAQERLRAKGRLAHEYRFQRKDGRYIWVRDQLRLLRDEQGKPKEIVGSWMDITDRKEAEIGLAKSEERYRSVVENTGTAMIIVNEDGTIAFANNQCTNTTGYSPEELKATDWRGYVYSDDLPMMENYFRLRFSDPERAPKRYEARLIHANGSIKNTLLTVSTIPATRQVVVSMIDVTDRVRAEEARRVLETAIDNAQECIMISDQENRLAYVNRAFEKLTGYSEAEVLGKTPGILKSGQHDQKFYQDLKSTIYSGMPWRGNMILKKKNGELYEVDASITPIVNEDGTPGHFVSVHRDVTKERELERRIQQNQRLEAIGTLAGGIAHDFNNLLTPIMGYTELCMDVLPPGSRVKEYLEEVLQGARRAKELVQQILSFSRSRPDKERKPLRVAPIVKEAMKLLRASIPSTIDIKQEIYATTEMIVGDPTEIHQVVMNLCTNAYHAMPDGGVLTVSLKAVDLDSGACLAFPNCRPGRYLKLSVEDTGCGIPPENLDKIFEPYFTTKEEGRGTGLGLAIVHRIVRSCGGAINVYSEVGKGTRFSLYFPVTEAEATETVERSASGHHGHEKILFVDDEAAIAELGKQILEHYGYSVKTCNDPKDALALFQKTPSDFDMVITDMTMPSMTGDKLAEALLRIRPDLPIIICTGLRGRITDEKAKEMGIRKMLGKPFSPSTLLSTIREIFDRDG